MGGKNGRNNFSRNTRIVQAKNVGKKIVFKVRINVFYIHTNIVTKKRGQKMQESIFPETQDFCELKILGNNRP